MDIGTLLSQLIFDYTLRTVALGSAALGITSGALGAFAILRKQSLLGDAISHAALPGVAIAFLLTRSKAPLVLLIAAGITGWLGTIWMINIVRRTRIKNDSALGLVLSVFFGFGMMLLTFTQRLPDARQAGLDKFLFGQAATLLESDVYLMAAMGGTALFLVAILWKELKLLSFDPDFGASLGFPIRRLDIILTTLLVVSIVIGLQTVGVVLMSAMIVAPGSAARQWTDRLGVMVLLSAFFGALAGVSGTLISSLAPGVSTGPTIVLSASLIVLFSLLFAPRRGLISRWIQQRLNRQRLRSDVVLEALYVLSSQHNDLSHGHSAGVIGLDENGQVPASMRLADTQRSLVSLKEQGLVREIAQDSWTLTPNGIQKVKQFRREE